MGENPTTRLGYKGENPTEEGYKQNPYHDHGIELSFGYPCENPMAPCKNETNITSLYGHKGENPTEKGFIGNHTNKRGHMCENPMVPCNNNTNGNSTHPLGYKGENPNAKNYSGPAPWHNQTYKYGNPCE